VLQIRIRIRICRIRRFLGLPDPHLDPFVASTDPAQDPSIINKYVCIQVSLSMAVALSFYISPKRFYSGGLSGHTEPLLKLLQILDNVLWEFYTSPLHPIQGKWTRLPIAEPIFSALLHCKVQRHYTESSKNIPRKETARLQSQFLHSCFCA